MSDKPFDINSLGEYVMVTRATLDPETGEVVHEQKAMRSKAYQAMLDAETPEEREARETAEANAQNVLDRILVERLEAGN